MAFNSNRRVEPTPVAPLGEMAQKMNTITRYVSDFAAELQVDIRGIGRRLLHTQTSDGLPYKEKAKHASVIRSDMWKAIKALDYAANKTGAASAHLQEVFVRTRRANRQGGQRQFGPQRQGNSGPRRQPYRNTTRQNTRRTA